jgi:hypothetical protein
VAKAEGNNNGQESEAESVADINAELQIAAEDRASETEEALHWNPDATREASARWDRAEAADKRTQTALGGKAQKGRGAGRARGRGYSRSSSFSNRVHPTVHTPVHFTDVPYGKGAQEKFWGKVTWGIFRLLGLD